jgi:hypothetical protein
MAHNLHNVLQDTHCVIQVHRKNNTVVTAMQMEWTKDACHGHQCPLNPLVQSNRHVHDPNQQNARTCSLDIYMLLPHLIYLLVLVHKGQSLGYQSNTT